MTSRWGGMGTVVVAAAVSVCGLFMLGGVAPTATIAPADGATTEATVDVAPSVPVPTTPPETTEPSPVATTIETTTTTTNATTTSTTSTTAAPTTTVAPAPAPVTASGTIVGVGGTVTFRGSCDDMTGPVVVSVTREADGSSEIVDTGLTSSPWTYTWTAPADERDASSFTFRFWCGTPGDTGGAPTDHQARVDMVASAAPPAEPSPAPRVPASADRILPETN